MSASDIPPLEEGRYTLRAIKKSNIPLPNDPPISVPSVYATATPVPDNKIALESMQSDSDKYKWIITRVKSDEPNVVHIAAAEPRDPPDQKYWSEARDDGAPITTGKQTAFRLVPIDKQKSTYYCIIRPDGAPDVTFIGAANQFVAMRWVGSIQDGNYPLWALNRAGSA